MSKQSIIIKTACWNSRPDANGMYPIGFTIYYNKKTNFYPTGIKCTKQEWEDSINSISPDTTEEGYYYELRNDLTRRGKRFKDHILTMKDFNFEAFKEVWEKKKHEINAGTDTSDEDIAATPQKKVKVDFLSCCQEYIDSRTTNSCQKWHSNSREVFLRFLKEKEKGRERQRVEFKEIDPSLLKDLYEWMKIKGRKRGKLKGTGLSAAYVSRVMRSIKTIFNYAIRDYDIPIRIFPFYKKNNRNGFRVPKGKKKNYVLKDRQLDLLFAYKPHKNSPKYQLAIDYFKMLYQTNGISSIDLYTLPRSSLQSRNIIYERNKTKASLYEPLDIKVPVSAELRKLIEKYENKNKKSYNLFSFMPENLSYEEIREQHAKFLARINYYLNEIAKHLGIEKLRTYDARHAWAYKMMCKGANFYIIMRGLGHSNLQTTVNYLHDFDDKVIQAYALKIIDFLDSQNADKNAEPVKKYA